MGKKYDKNIYKKITELSSSNILPLVLSSWDLTHKTSLEMTAAHLMLV